MNTDIEKWSLNDGKYGDRSSMYKISVCPFLEARAMTFEGMVRTCTARQKINRKRRLQLDKFTDNVRIVTLTYPCCEGCKWVDDLKQGYLPEELSHIDIIRTHNGRIVDQRYI